MVFGGTELTTLVVNHFTPESAARRAEVDECMQGNADNLHIDRIIVLASSDAAHRMVFSSGKLIWLEVVPERRPTFREFFNTLNIHNASPNDLNIVANADVYFDDTLAILKGLELQGVCLALTRWEHTNDGRMFMDRGDNSQDAWIFQGPIRPIPGCNYPMGCRGCDNRLACELRGAGYRVLNPCADIIAHHRHDSRVRNYGPKVGGKRENVKRTDLAASGLNARRVRSPSLIKRTP